MTNLSDRVMVVTSRADLATFVEGLATEVSDSPDAWENADLRSYLAAMAAWIEDMDGYYLNRGAPAPEQPSWRAFAEILAASTVYE